MKTHIVSLSHKEEKDLNKLMKQGVHSARVYQRALILCNANKQMKDNVIAECINCSISHVARTRQRYCTYGMEYALYDNSRSGRPARITAKDKACVVALACTDAPKGYSHWTVDLLVERIKQEGINMGRTKLWMTLQENELKPWREKNVVHS
jgi:transposase